MILALGQAYVVLAVLNLLISQFIHDPNIKRWVHEIFVGAGKVYCFVALAMLGHKLLWALGDIETKHVITEQYNWQFSYPWAGTTHLVSLQIFKLG